MRETYKGFALTLRDGRRWWITGDEYNIQWVEELATIMQLENCPSNSSPKLIFSKMIGANNTRYGENCIEHWGLCTKGPNDSGWRNEDHGSIRIWYHNHFPDIICEIKTNDGDGKYVNMWISLRSIYNKSISSGGLPFHAGLVELDGRGVLLAGPGGTGKSTCCRRLPGYWKALCDDETLVIPDKQGKYWAHPFPTWSNYHMKRGEKTWNVQYAVPLCGVFFLEQSKTDEITSLGEGKTAILMTESAFQVCLDSRKELAAKDRVESRKAFFNSASRIAKEVPAFRLRVSLHGRFWKEIEKVLKW